ncbi:MULTISPECIES: hypothetical protein [Nocardia]|uniref:hypothetical protein n=1 Tax=Nocardia violaceofusca TaxID=941182 RepID=UPI000AF2DAA1|nr:hypothetical protein [Nocardia violaceofusca]
MGRNVFVRAITPEEGRKLAQFARRSKVPVRVRRAVVVMASAQHRPVGLIARLMRLSESYVRQVMRTTTTGLTTAPSLRGVAGMSVGV